MTQTLHRLARQVAQVVPMAKDLPSPCQSICVMDEASGLCSGCLRTIDEIASWGRLADEQKRQVWVRIGERIGPF